MQYTTKGGPSRSPYDAFIECPHLLIAGSTGSGKSVIINGVIAELAKRPTRFILIDPKRVELKQWQPLPQCIGYADSPAGIINALQWANDEMMRRYKGMTGKLYQGAPLYVIIDEYADLMITSRKAVTPLILRIAQLGRAAGVHLIMATQRPTSNIITGDIKVNIDYRIALHVPTKQDSRNIIGAAGAEALPMYGRALYYTPAGIQSIQIPVVPDNEIQSIIEWYQARYPKQKPRHALLNMIISALS